MDDLKDMKQVMDFTLRISPESAEKYATDIAELNRRVEELHKTSQDKNTKVTDEESNKRFMTAKSELDKLEAETVSKYDKEMHRLDALRVANEAKYADVVKLARDAANQEKEISEALMTDEERRRYEQYTKNMALLEKKRQEMAKDERKEQLDKVTNNSFAPVAREVATGMGFNAGAIGEVLANLANPMGLLVVITKDFAQLVREGIEDARKRDREMISLLSVSAGGFRFGSGQSFLEMERVQGRLESNVPAEQRGQVGPALQNMVRSSPETLGGDVENRFRILINAADRLNMGWAEAATKIGEISRKSGETFETVAVVMLEANAGFQRKMKETGETFDLPGLRQKFTDLYDSMRIYNGSLAGAANMTTRFAHELDKGILTISDLVQLQTGMAKADDGQRAFMMEQFIRQNQGAGGEKGAAASRLGSMTEMNPLAMAEAMKRIVEGDDQERNSMAQRLGMSAGAMRNMITDFGMQYTRQEAGNISGGRNDLIADPIMRQLRVSAGLEREGLTYGGERSLEGQRNARVPSLGTFGKEAGADLSSVEVLRDASRSIGDQITAPIRQGFNEIVQQVREYFVDTGGKLDKINSTLKDNRPVVNVHTDGTANVNESTKGGEVDVDVTAGHHQRQMNHRAASQNAGSGL